jgi:hypothetical protein
MAVTRTGPDIPIDPKRQIAFYIRGVGTPGDTSISVWRLGWETIQQLIGAGLTSRIVDCYAATISVWRPGDRIYLFGFSRGAYTARCVAHVLELAGVPTADGAGPFSFEPTALRRVAKTSVRALYSLGLPASNLDKRKRKLDAFRAQYRSADAIPHFIGVWDTVAALGWSHYTLSTLRRALPIPFLSVDYDMHFVRDEYRKDFVRVPWGGSGTVSDGDIQGVYPVCSSVVLRQSSPCGPALLVTQDPTATLATRLWCNAAPAACSRLC